MSTLCVATDSKQFSHLLFHYVGVVKPFENGTVIKSYKYFNVRESYRIQLADKSDEAEVVNSICPAHLYNTDNFLVMVTNQYSILLKGKVIPLVIGKIRLHTHKDARGEV